MLLQLFRAAGYRTGLFGKWHLGDNYPYRPQDRGFEEVQRVRSAVRALSGVALLNG